MKNRFTESILKKRFFGPRNQLFDKLISDRHPYTRVTVSLYAALSREADVMVAVLPVYAAADVVAPYEWILGVQRICPFPD
ncbi:hypothetical protein TNCV_2463251 [Trichonephila clavipes]|nr:hypothetical protein TNCV_2463251 [Trichonephila clavipes]